MIIKISELDTFSDCQRKLFYQKIGLKTKTKTDAFLNYSFEVMDLLKDAIVSGDRTLLDAKLLQVEDDWFLLKKEKEQKLANLKQMVDRYLAYESNRTIEII